MKTKSLPFLAPGLTSVLLLTVVGPAPAQPAVEAWVQHYGGGGSENWGSSSRVATDNAGNVVVTGIPASFRGLGYTTIKYSGAGVALWTNRFGPAWNYVSPVIAVDGTGNVIVAGTSGDGSSFQYETVAYSGGGVPLWTNRY